MDGTSPIKPMELGEIYSTTFSLTRRTLPTAGVLVFAVYLIMALLIGLLVRDLLLVVGDILQNPEAWRENSTAPPEQVWELMFIYIRFIPIVFVSSIINILLTIACVKGSWKALNDQELTIGGLIRNAFSKYFWYIIAQDILVSALMGAGIFATMMLGALLGAFTMGIGTVLAVLAMYVGMIYFGICIMLGHHQVIINDRGPWKGLVASYELIKGNWWRTFGIIILLCIGLNVVIGILSLPALLPLMEALSEFQQFKGQQNPDPRAVGEVLQRVVADFPIWIVALYAIGISAFTLVWANLRTVMYADLQGRRESQMVITGDVDGFEMT